MTIEDRAVALFAQANPIPTPELLDSVEQPAPGVRGNHPERTRIVTDLSTLPQEKIRVARRPPLIGLVAALIVAVAAVGLWIRSDDNTVATPADSARAFLDARDKWDGQAAVLLFAPDATINDAGVVTNIEDLPAFFDWFRALDWRWTTDTCVEVSEGDDGVLVSCTYTTEDAWTRALDHAPVSGEMLFLIADGKINRLVHGFNTTDYGDVWETQLTWIFENHPEEAPTIFSEDFTAPVLSPESISLWSEYTEEFVASIAGT